MNEHLLQAESVIHKFYHSNDSEERHQCHNWLLNLQRSQEAWSVSWMLLESNKSEECQYYGAIILHHKICNAIHEVNKENLQELKTKLLSVIAGFGKRLKFVLAKLCATLASLLILLADEKFNLSDGLGEIEQTLEGNDCLKIILHVLMELPPQFKFLNLQPLQKSIVRKIMNDFIPTLVSMGAQILQDEQQSVYQEDMLVCFIRWVEFGVSVVDCLSMTPLFVSKMKVEEISEKVCEVLSELLTSPTSFSLSDTIYNVLDQVLQLEVYLEKSRLDENTFFLENLCRLLCNIGETHSNIFIKEENPEHQNVVLKFVKILLWFSSSPGFFPMEEVCSQMTLNFWYTLQDDLISLDVEELSGYQMKFHEAFLFLIEIYFTKAQFPPNDIYVKFNSEEKSQFRCYRIDVQDTIMYLHGALKDKCLQYFTNKLNALINDTSSTWQQFEVVLFLLSGVCSMIDVDEELYMPQVIQMLEKIPCNHIIVQNTLTTFIGSLSEWLNHHPNVVPKVLPHLLIGISHPETSNTCSMSLKEFCQECAQLLDQNSIKQILQTCYQCMQLDTTCSKVLVRLFEICGYIISVMPQKDIHSQLDLLITPLLANLKLEAENMKPTKITQSKVHQYLNCFSGLFRSLDPVEPLDIHPITIVYEPLIKTFLLFKKLWSAEGITIAATDCITKAIEVVRENLVDFVPVTCNWLYETFTAYAWGCLLETSALIIGMFASENKSHQVIQSFFLSITNSALNILQTRSDTIDCIAALMYLLTRVVKTTPEFIFNDENRQSLFLKCSMSALTLQETPTVKSVCLFLVAYINHSSAHELGKQHLTTYGREIMVQVLLCIAGITPRHLIDNFAEIILAFNKNNVTQLAIWFKEVFSVEAFPSKNPTALEKEHFQKAVLREKVSKSRMKQIVRDFGLICRGLNGMPHTV